MTFVINNSQIEVFDSLSFEKFYKKIIPIFKDCFPNKVSEVSIEELMDFFREFHQIANQLEIKTERGITRFIILAFFLNRDFYKRPEFSQLFKYDDIDKDECLDLIFEDATRISNNQKTISSSLSATNRNYKIVHLIEKIAKSIQ